MAERKLRNRRRKPDAGHVIRASSDVYKILNQRRKGRSWDCFLRRMLGLPDRAGNDQPLIEGMLEVTTGVFILKLSDATWDEVEDIAWKIAGKAAEKKKLQRVERPLRMREIT